MRDCDATVPVLETPLVPVDPDFEAMLSEFPINDDHVDAHDGRLRLPNGDDDDDGDPRENYPKRRVTQEHSRRTFVVMFLCCRCGN